MSERSNRVANFLRAQGREARRSHPADAGQRRAAVGDDAGGDQARRRGHPGDDAAGARRPARPLRARRRPPRRGRRGRYGASSPTSQGDYTRIVVGGPRRRLDQPSRRPTRQAPSSRRTGRRRADDPLLLYFTSGTTAKPKLVVHTHQSYPVGHLSTMYWIGLQAGRRPPQHQLARAGRSTPGAASSRRGTPGPCVFIYNYARFNAKAVLDTVARCGVTTLCAPPTVWRMLIQEDLRSFPVQLREVIGAGEPLNPEVIEQVQKRLGPDDPRRLRPDRDDGADRQLAGPAAQAGLDGPAAARATGSRCSIPTATRRRRARSALRPRSAADRADAGLQGRPDEDGGGDGAAASTAPATSRCATRTATSPTSAAPTTCSRHRTTGSARSSWRAC